MSITTSNSQQKLETIQDAYPHLTENSKDIEILILKNVIITKINPTEMTAKPTIVIVPEDTTKRSALLLA